MVVIRLFSRWERFVASVVLILVITVLISRLNLYPSLSMASSTVAFTRALIS